MIDGGDTGPDGRDGAFVTVGVSCNRKTRRASFVHNCGELCFGECAAARVMTHLSSPFRCENLDLVHAVADIRLHQTPHFVRASSLALREMGEFREVFELKNPCHASISGRIM